MARYTRKLHVPSCYVKRELLTSLENLILQKASDLEGVAKGRLPPHYNPTMIEEIRRNYDVTVEDRSGGRLELKSVEELPKGPMPGDTESMALSLRSRGYSKDILNVKVNLSITNTWYTSYYEVSHEGDSARETVKGICAEMSTLLDRFRHRSFVMHRSMKTLFALSFLGIAIGILAGTITQAGYVAAGLICGLSIWTILFYMMACQSVPHCIFDTLDNDRLLDWVKWKTRAVLGFAIFSVALPIIAKMIWGRL